MKVINPHDWVLLFRLLFGYLAAVWLYDKYISTKLIKSDESSWLRWPVKGLVCGFLVFLATWKLSAWWLIFVVLLVHWVVEFVGDQMKGTFFAQTFIPLFPLVILAGCWLVLMKTDLRKFWELVNGVISNKDVVVITLAYIVAIWPLGTWVGSVTERWIKQLKKEQLEGLSEAGKWIGRLERALVLTFVLLSQYAAIGFLLAVKSVYRFPEMKESKNWKLAEYIFMGTLFSFSAAILLGIAVKCIIYGKII